MELNDYNLRLSIAAKSPKPEKQPEYKNVSMRIDQDLFKPLESMANALGKSTSGLAGELLEAMIIRFDAELPQLRPDLTLRPCMDSSFHTCDLPIYEDEEGEYCCNWIRPGESRESEKSEDEIDEGVRRDIAQGLALQEDAKNGKAKI